MNREQFIDKYHKEILLCSGTLDIKLINCVYDKFNNSVDILVSDTTNKPTYIQLIDFEDNPLVIDNTLFYILPKDIEAVYFKYKHKLYSKYTVPIQELISVIYDVDYYINAKQDSQSIKLLCDKYPNSFDLGEEVRKLYGRKD